MASIENFDAQCNGVLIQADNFQGLNLIQGRYKNEVKGIYIDPPYNTDASPILYKNGYQHSSWAGLFMDRMLMARPLIKDGGMVCVAIDDFEYPQQFSLMDGPLEFNHVGTAVVRSKPQGRPTKTGFSANHEYAFFWSRTEKPNLCRLPRIGSKAERYPYSDEKGIYSWANFRKSGTDSDRGDRRKSFYPVYVKDEDIRVPEMVWNENTESWDVLEEANDAEVEVLPIDSGGNQKVWTCSAKRLRSEIADLKILRAESGGIEIQKKYRTNQDGALPGTWWDNPEYSASESGTKVLKDLFKSKDFDFPKSINLFIDNLRVLNIDRKSTVCDYFAGSNTTAHAIISLNREDGGQRKYILIEMGGYFDSVLVSRIAKIVYSDRWKDGKPLTHKEGISHCFKYLRLESYEDALNNLLIRSRSKAQADLLDDNPALREDYLLGYWLDVETADSPSLLNVDQFEDPFDYKLNISTGSAGAFKPTCVDLVETFNYLLGLRVKHIDTIRGFKIVTGTNPQDEKVLVIWRKLKEQNNATLEAFMEKSKYHPRDTEFDHVYVNGDHTLEDPHSKVKMIEIEFKRLMFDVRDL